MRCGRSPARRPLHAFFRTLPNVRCASSVVCCMLHAARCARQVASSCRMTVVCCFAFPPRGRRVVAAGSSCGRTWRRTSPSRCRARRRRCSSRRTRRTRRASCRHSINTATQDNLRCNTGQPPCSEAKQRQPTCNAARPFAPHRGDAASIRLAFHGIARGPSRPTFLPPTHAQASLGDSGVIYPESRRKLLWDLLMTCVGMYYALHTPLSIAFGEHLDRTCVPPPPPVAHGLRRD